MSQLVTKQLSPEWFAERKDRLTASQFAAAAGICPYTTRQSLYREKVGLVEPFGGNSATEWGSAHEKDALYAIECETGDFISPTGFWVHPDYGWLGGSPDGFLGELTIETKCPFYKDEVHQEIPINYMAQVQGCMEITGKMACLFGSWRPNDFSLFRVERSEEYWTWIFPRLEEFWAYVKDGKEPKRKKKTYFEGKISIRRIV